MSTVEITRKSAGPEGASIAPEQVPAPSKVRLAPFMLEDYLDAVEAHAALEDPENSQHIPWEQLREQLGL